MGRYTGVEDEGMDKGISEGKVGDVYMVKYCLWFWVYSEPHLRCSESSRRGTRRYKGNLR